MLQPPCSIPFLQQNHVPCQLCSYQAQTHRADTHHLLPEVCDDGIQGTLQCRGERPEVLGEVALAHQRQRGETLRQGDVVPVGWVGGWVGERVRE